MFLDNFDLLILKIFKKNKKNITLIYLKIKNILKNNFQCISDMNNKSSSELQGFFFSS